MAFEIGTTAGDYQILGPLGAGGMGKVYKVRNVISDRIEAMKVLLPDLAVEPELADRFMREIKVLASLTHPNIAALHTALRIENQLVMIMEFVEGITLEDRLHQGAIPLSDTLNYIDQVLSALSYAHGCGVIHRDIKPANMMLTSAGVVKLMDFGIAKPAGDRRLTMTGTTMGSLYYMAPEQVKGEALDPRADLYSLGVSLYEMVTGKRPFQGESNYAVMAAHLQQQPVAPIEIDPKLPAALNDVILKGLAKDPNQRFQSADDFRAAISRVRGIAAPAPPTVQAAAPALVSSASAIMSAPELLQANSPVAAGPVSIPGGGKTTSAVQPRQAQAPPPVTKAPGAGHRALYMGLGAVMVIIIIVFTAMELPKALKKAPVSSAVTPASSSPTGNETSASANTTSPIGNKTSAPASAVPGTPGEQFTPVPQPASLAPGQNSATQSAAPHQHFAQHVNAPHQTKNPATDQNATAPQQNLQSAAPSFIAIPSQPTSNSPGQPEGLDKLTDRMTLLASRANAVRTTLDNMQRQEQSQGLSMRGDITASLSRMEAYMDAANRALSSGNAATAKRNMDLTEQEVDRLEQFLGR